MASQIDITKPETGYASTASVRDNFKTARDEITALQQRVDTDLTQAENDIDDLQSYHTTYKSGADYASLNAAIAEIGGTPVDLVVGDTLLCTDVVNSPENINIIVLPSGRIAQETYSVNINGGFTAGYHTVFTGTGLVKFGDGVRLAFSVWGNIDKSGLVTKNSSYACHILDSDDVVLLSINGYGSIGRKIQTFPVDTTSPYVNLGDVYLTCSTDAATVTIIDFLGGVEGQEITIVGGGGTFPQQIADNENINLTATWSGTADNVLRLLNTGALWTEISRQ